MKSIRTFTFKNTLIGFMTGALLIAGSQAMAQEPRAQGLLSIDIQLIGGNNHRHQAQHPQNREPIRETRKTLRHGDKSRHHHHAKYRVSPMMQLSQELFLAPWQRAQVRLILGERWNGQMNRQQARKVKRLLDREQRRHWRDIRHYSEVRWYR